MIKNIENPSDLKYAFQEFQDVTKKLDDKQKNEAALKTLIALCRYSEKLEWKTEVVSDELVKLTTQLCNSMTELSDPEYKKYVAVLCHIHRCIVKKNCSSSSSIAVLKCIFDKPTLKLKCAESKNYFIMLVDSFHTVDNKFSKSVLESIMNMILKYFEIIDALVMDNFVWLIRKFDALLNISNFSDLNNFYQNIFTVLISNKDLVKKFRENESLFMFKKLLSILSLIHDNNSKCRYDKRDIFDLFFKLCAHLYQYNETYSKIFEDIANVFPVFSVSVENLDSKACQMVSDFTHRVFSLRDSIHSQALEDVCQFMKKVLCLTLPSWVSAPDAAWKQHVLMSLQVNVLKLINATIKVMRKSKLQGVQCTGCNFKSAIHDSLSLSYFGGMFCAKSSKCNLSVKELLQNIDEISSEQSHSLEILYKNGCPNWKSLWKKVENHQHNDSISLYSNKKYESSHEMFKIYISNFIHILNWYVDDDSLRNLAKAFYNMAICQSDLQLNYPALVSCYTSLALNSVLKSEVTSDLPHFQLIIQIKAKSRSHAEQNTKIVETMSCSDDIKHYGNNEELVNVWSACKHILADQKNAAFYKIFSGLNFGHLLLFELESFLKLWPSTNSLAGVFGALKALCELSQTLNNMSTASPENLGFLDIADIAITCGKAVTLLIIHSIKLSNSKIVDMVDTTCNLLEIVSQDHRLLESQIIFIKLMRANAMFALGLSRIYEKRKLGALNPLVETLPSIPLAPHAPNIHPDDVCDVTPAHQYLTLLVEEEVLEPLFKAVILWKNAVTAMESYTGDIKLEIEPVKTFTYLTCEAIELCCQIFALYEHEYSILAADICYTLARIADNEVCAIRATSYILENTAEHVSALDEVIRRINNSVYSILTKDDEKPQNDILVDASLEYLLSLSMYYHKIGSVHQGAVILSSVSNRILHLYVGAESSEGRKLDAIKLTYIKMLRAQCHFISSSHNREIKDNLFSILTCHINANIDCGDIVKSYEYNRGRAAILAQRMWLDSGTCAGEIALALGLVRRARSLLKLPLSAAQRLLLPRRAINLLILLAQADLSAERLDDCLVKIDGVKYILGDLNTSKNINIEDAKCKKQNIEKQTLIEFRAANDSYRNIEVVMDAPTGKYSNISISGSPTFRAIPFIQPAFVDDVKSCKCYKCNSVTLFLLYVKFIKLQAQHHFRNGETKIVNSFYKGGMKCIKYLFNKIDHIREKNITTLINQFSQRVFNSFRCIDMHHAECAFLNDAVIYFITEDEMDTARELNGFVLEASKKSHFNYFLINAALEQNLFLSQNDVFKKNSSSQLDIMDDLHSDLSSKLIITPEKSKSIGCFLTPSNIKLPSVNKAKRNLLNTSSPTSSMKKNVTNINRPAIRLRLEDAEENKVGDSNKTKFKTDPIVDEKTTPAPKLKITKAKIVDPSATIQTRKIVPHNENHVQNTKKAKQPEDGPAVTLLFGSRSQPKVYGNKAARNNLKLTLSPNNVIENLSKNNDEPKNTKSKGVLQSSSKENTLKNKLRSERVESGRNIKVSSKIKQHKTEDLNKATQSATRSSARKRV